MNIVFGVDGDLELFFVLGFSIFVRDVIKVDDFIRI